MLGLLLRHIFGGAGGYLDDVEEKEEEEKRNTTGTRRVGYNIPRERDRGKALFSGFSVKERTIKFAEEGAWNRWHNPISRKVYT